MLSDKSLLVKPREIYKGFASLLLLNQLCNYRYQESGILRQTVLAHSRGLLASSVYASPSVEVCAQDPDATVEVYR